MGANVQSCTDRILHAIDFGRLSGMETKRRLEQLIEAEVARMDAPADLALVEGCQSLLWQLHTHARMTSTDHSDRNYQRILATVDAWERRAASVRRALRWCAVAAAVLLLVVGLTGRLRWRWFEQHSTPDEQQHVIMGHEVSVEMVDTALATHEGVSSVTVDNVSKLPEILGFDLGIPEELGSDWIASYTSIRYFPGFIRITVIYRHIIDTERSISCVINCYTDIEYAYISFEQNREGERIDLGGFEMYVSENVEKASVCWYNNNIFLWLSGDVTPDDAVKLMYELIGGEHE